MAYKRLMRVLFIGFISAIFGSAIFGSAVEAASPGVPKSELHLLDGGRFGATRLAGIEIIMEPHVKTYWRTPGDAGLPPLFNWSGSENLDHVEVLWPLPAPISDPAGLIFGYEDHVIFPLSVTPKDATKPVHLALTLDYAVCGTLCVPMQAQAKVELAASSLGGADAARIKVFLDKVPRKAALHDGLEPGLHHINPDPTHPDALLITSNAPVTNLFVEGPTDYAFGDSVALSPTEWRVSLVAKPIGATLSQLPLMVTLAGPEGATETAVTLDATGAIR